MKYRVLPITLHQIQRSIAKYSKMTQEIPALQVCFLPGETNAKAPTRGSEFAAGYDMYASEDKVIAARGRALVKTGVSIAIPEGTYARVAARSGLAVKHGIDVGAGVVDYDYRGEVRVLLFNHSDEEFKSKYMSDNSLKLGFAWL